MVIRRPCASASPRVKKLLIACAAAVLLAGCGGGSDGPSTGSVDISEFKYAPETLTVDAGTKVTFTNADMAKHTATADDGTFDTKDLQQDANASVTLAKPGTFAYHCAYHRFMEGEIVVK